MSSIKILIKLLDLVENPETIRGVCKKITPSLVTLLSSEPEIQYVALKNINMLIQKRPIIFEKDIKMFFCTFTEPLYNKIEKLGILYKLVTMNNIDMVLNELREYASDVDVQFVRRSVRLIGQCAIKLEKAAQRCVETLVELVKTQVSFVIQEAIIGLRDIFRRYPNSYEGAMAIVNENQTTALKKAFNRGDYTEGYFNGNGNIIDEKPIVCNDVVRQEILFEHSYDIRKLAELYNSTAKTKIELPKSTYGDNFLKTCRKIIKGVIKNGLIEPTEINWDVFKTEKDGE